METPWLNINQMKQICMMQMDSSVSKFVEEINLYDDVILITHNGESPSVFDGESPRYYIEESPSAFDGVSPKDHIEESLSVFDGESPRDYIEENLSTFDGESSRDYIEESLSVFYGESPKDYIEESLSAFYGESPRDYIEESLSVFDGESPSDYIEESLSAFVEESSNAFNEEGFSPPVEEDDSVDKNSVSDRLKLEKHNPWKQPEKLPDKDRLKDKQSKISQHECTLDEQGISSFVSKKTPFTIHAEIDQFLHEPIFGNIDKNMFEFKDEDSKGVPIFNPTLINKTVSYIEEPHCRLVFSKIHDLLLLDKIEPLKILSNQNNPSQTVAIPLHDNCKTKDCSPHDSDCTYIIVPVVLGEFRIEAALEDSIHLGKQVLAIEDVSKEIVLTDCHFIPTKFSEKFKNGTRKALKGMLIIEGIVHQNIEYTALNKEKTNLSPKIMENHKNHLNQKMVLEIIIHLLQTQKVRANCVLDESEINYFE